MTDQDELNCTLVTGFTYHPDGLKFMEDWGGVRLNTLVWDGSEYLEARHE